MSNLKWKTIGIVGGGIIVIGGGYLLIKFLSSPSSPEEEKKEQKKKVIIESIASWLFGDRMTDSVEDCWDSMLNIPAKLQSLIKWVAIGGGVLIAVLVLVFAYRMAIGNTPDLSGLLSQLAYALPASQALRLQAGTQLKMMPEYLVRP